MSTQACRGTERTAGGRGCGGWWRLVEVTSRTSTNIHRPSQPPAHAEGGTRTPTGLRPLAPEASASTSSTTSAGGVRNGEYRRRYNLKSTLGLTAPPPISILRWPVDRVSIARNPRARHDYHLLETWEAGLVLTGTEVKSLRAGKASLGESYAHVRNGEVWLEGLSTSPHLPRIAKHPAPHP